MCVSGHPKVFMIKGIQWTPDMQKRVTHATQGRGNLSKIAEIILKSLSEVSYFTSKRHFWTQNDEITSLFHGF